MKKSATLLLIVILTASSVLMFKAAPASAATTPSVPEFTVKYVYYSYYIPPTYAIDPYTGENFTTNLGHYLYNRTIEFTIKNQPFTSYRDASGNYTSLYYNIEFKGHYNDEWSYHPYDPDDGYTTGSYSDTYNASDSDYTIIVVRMSSAGVGRMNLGGISDGDQVDFQMQTLIGHLDKIYTGSSGFSWVGGDSDHYYVFTGETSGWSETQTLTIGENQTTATLSSAPTPYQKPSQSEQEMIIGVAIAATVIATGLGLLIYLVKRK